MSKRSNRDTRRQEQRAAKEKITAAPSRVQAVRPLAQKLLRVGGNLSPEDVTAIMRQADNGYMYRLCDLGEEARAKDCHLGGLLYRRETAASSMPWQVVPTSPRPKALRIAAWVESVLRNLGEAPLPGFELRDLPTTLSHLNGAVLPGYACAEVIWQKDGKYVIPRGTLPIGARRFVYSQYDGSLRLWDATGASTPYPGIDLRADYPAGRFIVHRPRMTGAEGPREGLVRPLMWASLFRTWSITDWMRLAELAWKPYRWGEYGRDASNEDITSLDAALEALTSNGYARFPESTKFHVEFAKGLGDSKNHEGLTAFLAAEMSKLVLGATLTVEQGKTGAMALGNVHADVAKSLRDMDARALEATLRRQLIAPLIALNFGANAPVPEFRFLTEEGADLEALSQAIARLIGTNGTLLDIPQSWVRATFGIPDPHPGDLLMGGRVCPLPPEEAPPAPTVAEPIDDSTDEGPPADDRTMTRMLNVYRLDALRRYAIETGANAQRRVGGVSSTPALSAA